MAGARSAAGVFVGTPGSVQAVAIVGATAPNGVTYSAIRAVKC